MYLNVHTYNDVYTYVYMFLWEWARGQGKALTHMKRRRIFSLLLNILPKTLSFRFQFSSHYSLASHVHEIGVCVCIYCVFSENIRKEDKVVELKWLF